MKLTRIRPIQSEYAPGDGCEGLKSERSADNASVRRGRGACLLRMIFVKFDEIAERDRKFHLLIGIEGIESNRIFETSNDQSKTEGIKARLQKLQIIRETRELSLLFQSN